MKTENYRAVKLLPITSTRDMKLSEGAHGINNKFGLRISQSQHYKLKVKSF